MGPVLHGRALICPARKNQELPVTAAAYCPGCDLQESARLTLQAITAIILFSLWTAAALGALRLYRPGFQVAPSDMVQAGPVIPLQVSATCRIHVSNCGSQKPPAQSAIGHVVGRGQYPALPLGRFERAWRSQGPSQLFGYHCWFRNGCGRWNDPNWRNGHSCRIGPNRRSGHRRRGGHGWRSGHRRRNSTELGAGRLG